MLDKDLDPAEWVGLPTDDQMWRQQAALCARECAMLNALLTEQRVRLARLTHLHHAVCQERDQLQAQAWRYLQRLAQLPHEWAGYTEQKREADE
jgi:hypothetical protein